MTQAGSRLTPRGREWLKLVQQWERSDISMREFCVRRGLKVATMSWWRQELKRRAPHERPGANRVELVEITSKATRTEAEFEVELANGLRVRVPARFDATALKQLLGVLATC